MTTPLTTAEIVERPPAETPVWRYSINYGPDGEEDWANLITPDGRHVANIRTHDARAIVEGLNQLASHWHEIDMLTNAGIVEVATRNPSVMEYMRHWEARAEAAEAELAKVRTATVETLSMCERYADFIRTSVKADDIEMHPYLPELEQIIERARAALSGSTV